MTAARMAPLSHLLLLGVEFGHDFIEIPVQLLFLETSLLIGNLLTSKLLGVGLDDLLYFTLDLPPT
jgi:hypothetical protein